MPSTYTKLRYHLIFRCCDQQPLITPEHRGELYPYISGIISNHRGKLLQIGGMTDHIHILAGIHPSVAVASMVRLIKANSSKWLNKRGPHPSWFRWEPGYGAFTVSETEVPKVGKFIVDQEEYHQRQSFADEFGRFAEQHGFEFKEDGSHGRRRTYAWLRIHIVFSTKDRMELIAPSVQDELFTTIREVVAQKRGELIEIDGAAEHVHLLVAIAPAVAVVDLLRPVKNESSRWMARQSDAELPFAWQRGYGAFSVSLSQMPVVVRYIQQQKSHHQTISFADEFRKLLEEHGLVLRYSM